MILIYELELPLFSAASAARSDVETQGTSSRSPSFCLPAQPAVSPFTCVLSGSVCALPTCIPACLSFILQLELLQQWALELF